VPFTLDIEGIATEVSLTVHGQRSGGGTGSASFRDYAAPTTPLDCAGANGGVKQLGFSASFETDTPMVSDAPSSSPTAQAASNTPASSSPSQPAASTPSESSSSGQTQASSSTPAAKKKAKPKKKPKAHKKKHKRKTKSKKKKRH